MSIRIEITMEKGETLLGRLREAGILADAPVITPAEAEEQRGLEPPTTLHERVQAETPVEQPPAPTRRRGRPPKNPPTTIEEVAAQTPSQVFAVRRYGGELDYEFVQAADAVARLKTLIEQAADAQALDSLAQHNEPLSEMLTEEMSEEISTAFDTAYAALTPPAEKVEAPAPAAAPPAGDNVGEAPWPRCEDKMTPLLRVPLDDGGARNAIFAIAEGAPPKFGMVVGRKLLDEFGITRLRDLPSGDPKMAAIARRAAEILGLPVIEQEGLL